jgi:DNA-binding GntR family transcriptional regulator
MPKPKTAPSAAKAASKTPKKPNGGADRTAKIYRALRHAIIEQALEPGAKLPEDAIGERFGVSRTIVRHALGQLAAEGLVELRHNRGAAVATPSWNEARDVFDIRRGVERLVIDRLSGRLSPDDLARLNTHVGEEERARGNNEMLSIRLASEFHMLLAEMTGSDVLMRYVGELSSRCGLILATYSRPHSSECAVSEHRAIIAALAAGETKRASSLMEEHLEAVAGRALIANHRIRERDIKDILAPYAKEPVSKKQRARD